MTTYSPRLTLRTLVEHDVAFVVVGGVAAGLRGSPSVTFDLDVCYARDPANLERLATALRELKARLRGVDEEVPFLLDAETLAAGDTFTFDTTAGPLDILGTPAGTRGYEELAANADEFDVGGFTIRVAGLDDLIRMKRAAGRPKDRVEVEILEAVREEVERDAHPPPRGSPG